MLLGDRISVVKILLVIICILYITFLFIDLSLIEISISSNVIKYTSIVMCFLISLLTGSRYLDKTDKLLLQLGLFITLMADFLLLFTEYLVLGVGIFSVVHIIYYIRYNRCEIKIGMIKFTAFFLIITVTYLMMNYFITKIELIYAVALFYAVSILNSVLKAIKVCRYKLFPYPNEYLITWGMVLFLLCDINVVFFNISKLISKSSSIISLLYNTSASLMWLFYLPSQVLLSLSGYDFKQLSKKYRTGDTL
ncbi:hypothetical protein DW1_0810 [Proteiniborus sp. DW1]|uniref:lysoplasmalogenase family protein n=1 Tax=Proteiniborus sp. DW1 TaxID=1889883 RepID=UPI00092E0ABA|nr:lysoplasmalogenase family protein [Proteiniborus sp. DW1]SCG82418.1 hypothetical protein DW1_0810 [Proteiniborus sp. DW1]